jgi:hypothetical protein
LNKTGSVPGIDKIYQASMALWRKFKKYGMSALRDEPVPITYPNTLAPGQCTNAGRQRRQQSLELLAIGQRQDLAHSEPRRRRRRQT